MNTADTFFANVIAKGTHGRIGVCVQQGDQTLLDRVYIPENSLPGPTKIMTPLGCVGRPILSAAALRLCSEGGIALSTAVADIIPEFGGQGREAIQIRHVLTHETGYRDSPQLPTGVTNSDWWDEFRQICLQPLPAPPGTVAHYQEARFWFLLGGIVTRLAGRSVPDVMGEEYLRRTGDMLGRTKPSGHESNGQKGWRGGIDSYASARGLARFMRSLAVGPLATVTKGIGDRQRTGRHDEYYRCVRDWGLGVMLESRQWGAASVVFSRMASTSTFGHTSRSPVVAMYDPEADLAVAVVGDRGVDEMVNKFIMRSACTSIYRSLASVNA
jgi:CubicO group peptidase (beta-lactamase class C family)